ncbi:MAG: hypothetical protein NTV23_02045 [Propionibacteriales bacterium]|nr:hypothetical protein [Propionibacteriales bacterium]
MPRRRSERAAEETRAWVDVLVRSGLGSPAEVLAQVIEAVRADHPSLDGEQTAASWIATARSEWLQEAAGWTGRTDYDRLQEAFTALEARGVVVLQGCPDHWSARDELARSGSAARGIAWFTAPDVWHAVDEGMLEVNLWHPSTANTAPGDELLDAALSVFATAGLAAHFDEGRIEVSAHWRRRPVESGLPRC